MDGVRWDAYGKKERSLCFFFFFLERGGNSPKGIYGVRAQLWVGIFFLYIFIFNFCVFRWGCWECVICVGSLLSSFDFVHLHFSYLVFS